MNSSKSFGTVNVSHTWGLSRLISRYTTCEMFGSAMGIAVAALVAASSVKTGR
jgi:hypothetical protein